MRDLDQPPKVQRLHLSTDGKQFRPCLEDVIEFLVHDLDVDPFAGWESRIEKGRAKWRAIQLAAALRDVTRGAPEDVPEAIRSQILSAADFVRPGRVGAP